MGDVEEFRSAGEQNAGADQQDQARKTPDSGVDLVIDRCDGLNKLVHIAS